MMMANLDRLAEMVADDPDMAQEQHRSDVQDEEIRRAMRGRQR